MVICVFKKIYNKLENSDLLRDFVINNQDEFVCIKNILYILDNIHY